MTHQILAVNQWEQCRLIEKNYKRLPQLTEEEVELLTTPFELAEYKNTIMASMLKGTKRHIESEPLKNVEVG
jgi:hypothetical protein